MVVYRRVEEMRKGTKGRGAAGVKKKAHIYRYGPKQQRCSTTQHGRKQATTSKKSGSEGNKGKGPQRSKGENVIDPQKKEVCNQSRAQVVPVKSHKSRAK